MFVRKIDSQVKSQMQFCVNASYKKNRKLPETFLNKIVVIFIWVCYTLNVEKRRKVI